MLDNEVALFYSHCGTRLGVLRMRAQVKLLVSGVMKVLLGGGVGYVVNLFIIISKWSNGQWERKGGVCW